MSITKPVAILLGYYVIIVICWLMLYVSNITSGEISYWYQFAFGLIPIMGGITGLIQSSHWGMLKSKVGSALFFISCGLITWGIGQMFWSIFYNLILRVEIPYPSIADFLYILSWPLWAIGMINLSLATGATAALKRMGGKLLVLCIPALFILISYYLLITIARQGVISDFEGGSLKVFFDLAYPMGDVVILTITVLIYSLSRNYLGGRFKIPILLILIGFIINYFTDFWFAYSTTTETYYNGHYVDLLYPTVLTLIGIGVSQFTTDFE